MSSPEQQILPSELSSLRFTNRARCALDSKVATHSAFVLIDSYDAGKLAHSLAQATRQDPAVISKQGMVAFRLSVTDLLTRIMGDIVKGRLPLLPSGAQTDGRSLPGYRALSAKCSDGGYCTALDDYIARLWARSQTLETPDRFYPATGQEKLGCYYLKKFSPFQANLATAAPDAPALAALARAALDSRGVLTHCLDSSGDLNSRYASIQIDLQNFQDGGKWEKVGFDFWYSVKVYFSWAWRNAPSLSRFSEPFDFAFRSIPVEESLLFVPNGCASIDPPQCDQRSLSVNSLRDFARAGAEPDSVRMIPHGADRELLKDPAPSEHADLLDLTSDKSAADWVQGLRERFIEGRANAKRRLLSATTTMDTLLRFLDAQRIVSEVAHFVQSPPQAPERQSAWKNEIYYLCSELTFANHKDMSALRRDLEVLQKAQLLDEATAGLTDKSLSDFYGYYQAIADSLAPVCESLETSGFWNGFVADSRGLAPWFKEVAGIADDDASSLTPPYADGEPLLAYKSYDLDWDPNHAVCMTGVDCARKALRSMVDFYAVFTYADAFLPVAEAVNSPAVFNPYAVRTACKVYDPWFKTKAAFQMLMVDLGNAALFGWNAAPIYVSSSVRPGEVTSFDRLMKDGKVQFNPKMNPAKLQLGVVADFGSLTGIPCAISVSQAPQSPPVPFYVFDGISVGACKSKDHRSVDVSVGGAATTHPADNGSACVSCYLSLRTVANIGSLTPIGAYVKTGYYILNAGARFFANLHDPVNVPHSKTVNIKYTVETFKRFNGVPKRCVRRLSRGRRCLGSWSEEQAVDFLEHETGGYAEEIHEEGIGPELRRVRVRMSGCAEEFWVTVRTGEGYETGGMPGHSVWIERRPSACGVRT